MDARKFLTDKYNLDLNKPSPIEIPNVGRNTLCEWFRELDFKRGAEIGVEFGIFSEAILRAHPSLELFCVDSWQNYEGYLDLINQKPTLPNGLEIVKQKLSKYNAHCIQGFSHKVAKQFTDNSLDFVYIDANHNLPWVMDDIIDWEKKVRPGGIVAGHDYVHFGSRVHHYVIEAVRWYTELKPIPLWFLLGTKARIEGQIRDRARSWMWIK